jgi:hypothetical protein
MKEVCIRLLILSNLVLCSCEEPYDLRIRDFQKEYVVDGLITDQPGPHEITITYSAAYSLYGEGNNLPVNGAVVSITDSEGAVEILAEAGQGKYITSAGFKGISGNKYILYVQIPGGDELISDPELLPAGSPITESHFEFAPENEFHLDGHRVWVTVADMPGQKNYYRWIYTGVFQFVTYFDGIIPFSTTCWKFEYFRYDLKLSSDRFVDGNLFDQNIAIIPYFSGSPYLLTVYQYSLSREAFDFWNSVDNQINNSSGLFGVMPFGIRGNMRCVNDADKNVLGYFGASSMIKHPVYVTRADGKVKNLITYPRNVYCWTFGNTAVYDPVNSSTWPDGWPR